MKICKEREGEIGMSLLQHIKEKLSSEPVVKLFRELYGREETAIEHQMERYMGLVSKYIDTFQEPEQGSVQIFSTPGRTEVGGNHTDHNHGRVLAAGINLDSIAVASPTSNSIVTVYSEGYPEPFMVDLNELDVKEDEKETTYALIRGIAARLKELGYKIGGFNAYITSDVLPGSGLSSSASIEVLLGTIFNHLYNEGKIEAQLLAMIGQYAENVYFGKPSGLMDQMACAVGGFVAIDFKEPGKPIVKKVDFDFAAQGYSLLVVDTGGSHADLTEDYASIPMEMKAVANTLGAEVCRELSMEQLIANIPMLREKVNDRAILRAMHFLAEDNRVVEQVKALEQNDFQRFLDLVTSSGNSSWKWLQNCFTTHNPGEQGITLALAVTENFLARKGKGACRVHGGGFAGTIQVFMPLEYVDEYVSLIESIFGDKAVTLLSIRPYGTIRIV